MIIKEMNGLASDELLIFLHLPKTAGVSMHQLLFSVFGQKYFRHSQTFGTFAEQLSIEERQVIKCVSGHFKYGIHKKLGRNGFYFTVVRDPIERMISLYNHKLRRNKFLGIGVGAPPPSIDDWMRDKMNGRGRKVYSQCEAISGNDDFESAVKSLKTHYLVYSDISQIDYLVVELQKFLGCNFVQPLAKLNARPTKHVKIVPSDAVREEMNRFYAADRRLVDFCREQFANVFG